MSSLPQWTLRKSRTVHGSKLPLPILWSAGLVHSHQQCVSLRMRVHQANPNSISSRSDLVDLTYEDLTFPAVDGPEATQKAWFRRVIRKANASCGVLSVSWVCFCVCAGHRGRLARGACVAAAGVGGTDGNTIRALVQSIKAEDVSRVGILTLLRHGAMSVCVPR